MAKRALITGITGQDGSYLAELLLDQGYEVFGTIRRLSAPNSWRIEHILDRVTLIPADLLDQESLLKAIDQVRPHEVYNLAAMSFVPASWDQPMLTGEFNAQGVTRVLEAIRHVSADALRRYPQPMADDFRQVAARVHGVGPDSILAGNGSDDILQIALRAYCGPGDVLASPAPTYSLYPVLAELADVRYVTVPWGAEWSLPADALLAAGPRAIFFANPNAPSGTAVPSAAVGALASRTGALVLVDEAYVDFADADCLGLLSTHEKDRKSTRLNSSHRT